MSNKQELIGGSKECEELVLEILQETSKLKAQNKIMRKALEFYGHDYMFVNLQSKFPNFGSTARESLKKVEELDNE